MASLLKKVEMILRSELKDFESHLSRVPHSDHVMGSVVSSSFRRMDHEKRQALLWDQILAQRLTGVELARLGPIVTMTPESAEVHFNGAGRVRQKRSPGRRVTVEASAQGPHR